MTHPQTASIVATLKTILRRQRMTYQELAPRLEMSESGVKKLLNGRDISLGRILEICDVLSVPFSEVVSAAGPGAPHVVEVSEESQAFFLENVHYYYVLARLIEVQYSRDALQAETGLSDASMEVYLRKLSALGFFPLEAGKRAVVSASFIQDALRGQGVSIRVGARLGRLVRQEMSHRLLEAAEENSSPLAAAFLQRKLTLTPESVAALRQSLQELLQQYSKRASFEAATCSDESLVNIGWSYALAPFDGAYPVSELTTA